MKYVKYWFAHWCAYQMTAINLGVWRFRFLFHDMDKIILMNIFDSEKAQKIHTRFSSHHFTGHHKKYDYMGMVIDWECSRFTKKHAQMNAYNTLHTLHPELVNKIEPLLIKIGINKNI